MEAKEEPVQRQGVEAKAIDGNHRVDYITEQTLSRRRMNRLLAHFAQKMLLLGTHVRSRALTR
jgi:hypothetical protein